MPTTYTICPLYIRYIVCGQHPDRKCIPTRERGLVMRLVVSVCPARHLTVDNLDLETSLGTSSEYVGQVC